MCSSLGTFDTEETQSYSVLKHMCSVVSMCTQGEIRYRGRVRDEEGKGGRERELGGEEATPLHNM